MSLSTAAMEDLSALRNLRLGNRIAAGGTVVRLAGRISPGGLFLIF